MNDPLSESFFKVYILLECRVICCDACMYSKLGYYTNMDVFLMWMILQIPTSFSDISVTQNHSVIPIIKTSGIQGTLYFYLQDVWSSIAETNASIYEKVCVYSFCFSSLANACKVLQLLIITYYMC